MRFLMLNWRDPRNPRSGGAERVTQGYLGALRQRGHEVFWFANSFPGQPANQEMLEGIQIIRGGSMGTSILAARRWYRQQAPFDLVIDQHHGLPWYAPWWCDTQCIAYVHEVLGPIWDVFYRWPKSSIGKTQERWTHWLYRNVPFWTACESTGKGLRRHGVKNITLIPYGVATQALSNLEEKPLVQPLRLTVVSRLAPNKRIDHCIRAYKCLLDRQVKAELTIIGTGDAEPTLRRLADELGIGNKVTFTGGLPEKEKDLALQASHVLLHTSLREGWGLNVIEANAMGTPAVVYPVEGLIESTVHEVTGLVSQEQTPESLAQSLVSLLSSPDRYQEFRRAAWERAKTFHWNQVLPRACDWLESMARPRPVGDGSPASG